MSENKKYHTFLPYKKLNKRSIILKKQSDVESKKIDEKFRQMSHEEQVVYIKKHFNSFWSEFSRVYGFSSFSELYHDITCNNNEPNYKIIEGLGLLYDLSEKREGNSVRYNGYEVIIPSYVDSFCIYIPMSFIVNLGSNINPHLLAYCITKGCNQDKLKTTIFLNDAMMFFNESLENITSGLKQLQSFQLIDYQECNSNKITITINRKKLISLDKDFANLSYTRQHLIINRLYDCLIFDEFECPHCYEKINNNEEMNEFLAQKATFSSSVD